MFIFDENQTVMKRLFLFILFLLPSLLFAQDIEKAKLFFKQNEEKAKTFYQSVLDESEKTFSFESVKYTQGYYQFKYFDESTRGTDNLHYVYFYCSKYEIGGNPDLEIKGDEVYTLSQGKGKFLDFAKWWIKYINPNETLESLSKKGKDKFIFQTDKSEETLQILKQSDGSWIIRGY